MLPQETAATEHALSCQPLPATLSVLPTDAPCLPLEIDSPSVALWRAALGRRRSVGYLGAALALFVLVGVLGLPAAAGALLGAGVLAYAAQVTRDLLSPKFSAEVHGPLGPPLRAQVRPEDIVPDEIRAVYLATLLAHEDVRTTLGAGPPALVSLLGDVYRRCGELVQASGRVARNGNPMHAYLVAQGPGLDTAAARLDDLGAMAQDEQAARAFERAASASRRHHELHRQIQGLYDRVRARLAAVAAFLGVVRAVIVKLQLLDLEQTELAGTSMTESLDDLRGELDVLETTLEGALAA